MILNHLLSSRSMMPAKYSLLRLDVIYIYICLLVLAGCFFWQSNL